eukprot:Phypoly_transcript_13361.p1 GENE.Phypoly_transcript_13361~~Phypoly_transcript_13361.p1  ORF type:complete len:313 (+),score=90.41 Phypoly_transcript_13361:45-941(+)
MGVVEVELTDHIRSAFNLVLDKKKGVTAEELAQIRTCFTDSTKSIPFSLLQTTSKSLQALQSLNELPENFPIFTHELIRGSKVLVPSITTRIETEEMIEKRKKLEAYVSNLRYKKMVKNISTTSEQEQQQAKAEMADFKSQLGMGLNIVFSLVVAMLIGFYVGKRLLHSDLGGIIVALILMIGALVVETSLFTIHLSQVDMKKEKETKKALARENQERINGGLNLTPHLLNPPKNYKTQSYTLDGKELVSMPSHPSSSPSPQQLSSPKIEEIEMDEPTDENDKKNRKMNKRNKKSNKP